MKYAPQSYLEGLSEFAELDEAGPDTEEKPHSNDADHGGDAPYKAVDCTVDFFKCFQHENLIPFW